MRTSQISCSYDSSKIMRIFYLIKYKYKRIFSLASGSLKYILNISIFVSCTYSNYSLMMSCISKPVKSFLLYIADDCGCLLCFPDYALNWSILTPIKYI